MPFLLLFSGGGAAGAGGGAAGCWLEDELLNLVASSFSSRPAAIFDLDQIFSASCTSSGGNPSLVHTARTAACVSYMAAMSLGKEAPCFLQCSSNIIVEQEESKLGIPLAWAAGFPYEKWLVQIKADQIQKVGYGTLPISLHMLEPRWPRNNLLLTV